MPRPRLALRAYATFHGQMLVGPYADPNQVELEAWAELPQRCTHIDRAKLTPVRRFIPFGGVRLKVISADTMLPVAGAVASIHSLLVEQGEQEAAPCRRRLLWEEGPETVRAAGYSLKSCLIRTIALPAPARG